MPIEHLDSQKAFALIGEMTSTRNLLGYGVKVLRVSRFMETTRDPIMTLLSIGVEKLLKLTVGVVSLDETTSWPSKSTMTAFGHGIDDLFDHAMVQIRSRTATSSDYVQDLVATVENDIVLRPLLAALDRYGKSGRFYNLDLLADRPQPDTDPAHMWDEAEGAALGDPAIARLQLIANSRSNDNQAWDNFYAALQGRMADSIEGCWNMISRVGINHALGVTGDVLGWELAPNAVGRQ